LVAPEWEPGFGWQKPHVYCNVIWAKYGPKGEGWLKEGAINPEWQAKQDTLHALEEREKELKPAPGHFFHIDKDTGAVEYTK